MIDTKHVTDRRSLRFDTLADALREADRIAAAEHAGTLRVTGNWSVGQMLGHLAFWINAPFDGYPPSLRPPWFVKLLLRTMKSKYLKQLPAGARIPNIPGGTLGIDPISTDDGLARFRSATQRLEQSAPQHPNIIFGPMTQKEWIAMNLRHAELHMSFFHPTRE
jgi:hypothetical protein